MGQRDPRVDAYIENAAPFAQPVLTHLREVVHAACPEVQESLKWRSPSFEYKGLLCGMAAFKQHCAFGFWKHELVTGLSDKSEEAMGSFGRITSVKDLPARKLLTAYVKKAMELNDKGVKAPRNKTAPRGPLRVPADLAAALKKNARARATFDGFSPSHRREYVEWIAGAKREETRKRRLATAVEWMSEGKTQSWRYERA
jgi:uncharacterized protein YdeI (YjbR/CyaY-like superfamily)